MRRGADLLRPEQAELVQVRQRQAAPASGRGVQGPALADFFAGLPDRDFTETRLTRSLRTCACRWGARVRASSRSAIPRGELSELVFGAHRRARPAGRSRVSCSPIASTSWMPAIYSREAGHRPRPGRGGGVFRIRRSPTARDRRTPHPPSETIWKPSWPERTTVEALAARGPRRPPSSTGPSPRCQRLSALWTTRSDPSSRCWTSSPRTSRACLHHHATLSEHGLTSPLAGAWPATEWRHLLRPTLHGRQLTDPARLNALADASSSPADVCGAQGVVLPVVNSYWLGGRSDGGGGRWLWPNRSGSATGSGYRSQTPPVWR